MAQPGRYRILRKIADGGMAEIFLAVQRGAEGFERPVVLKRILAALVADPQFRNLMIDEAHVAMSLNHSNIAQVLDLGHAGGRYFLVLEFVDGWDLNLIINRVSASGFPLPPELTLYVAGEVCRALSYAHAKTREGRPLGIVHRDVTPHNVLISEQGEVKLTDFGIAKAMNKRERTGAGIIKGKLAFMSPEQASGGSLDARSDLFSVGTMLYLMSTGRRPFEAPTDLEAILRVRQCDFPAPDKVKPDIEPKLATVIMRAMRLAVADRYQSAEEMLVDIEAVQRTVFQPAGQTELKRWLAALQERDSVPPIGRTTRLPAPSAAELSGDLVEGDDLVFDEEPRADQTLATGAPADLRAPPPIPAGALPPTIASPPPQFEPSVSPLPAARPLRWRGVLLVAGLAAAGLVYVQTRGPEPPLVPAPPSPAPSVSPEPRPAPPPPKTALAAADAARTVTARPDSAPTVAVTPPPPPPEETAPVKDDKDDEEPTAAEAAEDEEALLKHTEPDAEKKVIGDDTPAAPPPPPRPPRPGTRAEARPEPSKPKPPEIPVVSVHIATRPVGAVIRLKDRVFGRAPMNLRFRPGVPFDLSFVKTGYVTKTRRFTFAKRKNQAVTVTLEKRPEKKKSFFRRLFGG
jgi:serine/threonine protein kinase